MATLTLLDRLNELKNQSGLNAKQLTSELGISNTAFTDWNKGKGSPSLDAVIKFADYFNVTIDYLVYGKDTTDQTVKLDFSNKADIELLEKFHELPPELRNKLITYLDGMLAAISASASKDEKRLFV